MARPANKQETKSLEIAVPQALHDYLGFLAANTVLGASESAVASYVLTKQLEEMLRTGFHTISVPRNPSSSATE